MPGHHLRTRFANQAGGVSLPPTSAPLDLPNLRPFVGVVDPVTLWSLIGERWRILGEILHFTWLGLTTTKSGITTGPTVADFRRISQCFWLVEPSLSVRRNFDDKRLGSRIKSIQKIPVAAIEFICIPSHHGDAIGLGTIDQLQGNLWFGFEFDLVRNFRFFRRASSSAHSRGR